MPHAIIGYAGSTLEAVKMFHKTFPKNDLVILPDYYGKEVMTYTMVKKTPFKFPTERYLNIVKKGYKDCNLDKKYLLRGLSGS